MFRRTLALIFVIFAAAAFVSTGLIIVPMWNAGIYSPTLFLRALLYFLSGATLMILAGREFDMYKQGK